MVEIGAVLGLALKTVGKLLDDEQLLAARRALDEPSRATRQARLLAIAAEAVQARLAEHEFNQSRVAVALGTSRTTVVKLMRDLGLRRATDLSLAEIEQACSAARGDLDDAAHALRVSAHALKKQMTLLRLREREGLASPPPPRPPPPEPPPPRLPPRSRWSRDLRTPSPHLPQDSCPVDRMFCIASALMYCAL